MSRYNRLVDNSPKRDIHRSDVVCVTSEAARLTSKFVSRWSVRLRDVSTRWAGPGRVSRIDEDDRDAHLKCFVLDKGSKLVETPRMQIATLCLSNRYPGSDALKIFKSNRSFGVFGFRNQLFGDAVVNVLGESGHPTGEFLEMSLGRLRTFALKSGFKRVKPVTGLVDLLTGMDLAIRIHSKILDSKIDSKRAFWIVRGLLGYLDHRAKVEDTFDEYQIDLAPDPVHPDLLVIPDLSRDKLPALESRQRNGFQPFPGEDALVIDHRTIQPKLRFDGLVSLVGFNNFGDSPDSKLSRKTELLSDVVVGGFMDFNLVGLADRERNSCDIVTRFIEAVHRIQEHLILFFTRIEFDHQGFKHHIEEGVQLIYSFRYNGRGTLLPGLKTGVSATPAPQVIL